VPAPTRTTPQRKAAALGDPRATQGPRTDEPMTVVEACDFLRISGPMLRKLEARGEGPSCIRIGRRKLYRRGDLSKWLDRHVFAA
jgi:hypothetical protein